MNWLILEREGKMVLPVNYFSTFTRRHIGAARTRATSPAANSLRGSCRI